MLVDADLVVVFYFAVLLLFFDCVPFFPSVRRACWTFAGGRVLLREHHSKSAWSFDSIRTFVSSAQLNDKYVNLFLVNRQQLLCTRDWSTQRGKKKRKEENLIVVLIFGEKMF